MNQEKIGKFISECRREKNFTQENLAELLGVSNRTISKWENGKCMPDYSILPIVCEKLDITINEFFSGERLEEKQYQKKFEENIILNMDVLKKKMWKVIRMISFGIIGFIVLFFIIIFIFLSIFQIKDYLNNEEVDVRVCKNNNNIILIIKSLDEEGIMLSSTKEEQKNFFKAYRYKYLNLHQEYSNVEYITFPNRIPIIYFNDKLIYKDDMSVNECDMY